MFLMVILGLAVGSFLNVCISRLPRGLSIISPPSRCPRCEQPLRWFDNIPVISYVVLRGRCRACGEPISLVYPLVEAATALVFAWMYWYYGPTLLLATRLVFASAMIVLFVIDLQLRILPNLITMPGILVGLCSSLLVGPGWVASLLGVLVGAGSLYGMAEAYYRMRGVEGMGMGDVKMLGMIGAFLGWKLVLVTLILSSLFGSVVGLGILIVKKESWKYALPFGTFLAIGALMAAAKGDGMIAWYLSFYAGP